MELRTNPQQASWTTKGSTTLQQFAAVTKLTGQERSQSWIPISKAFTNLYFINTLSPQSTLRNKLLMTSDHKVSVWIITSQLKDKTWKTCFQLVTSQREESVQTVPQVSGSLLTPLREPTLSICNSTFLKRLSWISVSNNFLPIRLPLVQTSQGFKWNIIKSNTEGRSQR